MPHPNSGLPAVVYIARCERDQNLLSRCFGGGHWNIIRADSVRSGRALLSSADVDVVISDMELSDGSWHDLCLHTIPGNCPPIVVAADSIDAREWAEALSLGAFDIVTKPFHTDEVLYVVHNAWLNRAKQKSLAGSGQRPWH